MRKAPLRTALTLLSILLHRAGIFNSHRTPLHHPRDHRALWRSWVYCMPLLMRHGRGATLWRISPMNSERWVFWAISETIYLSLLESSILMDGLKASLCPRSHLPLKDLASTRPTIITLGSRKIRSRLRSEVALSRRCQRMRGSRHRFPIHSHVAAQDTAFQQPPQVLCLYRPGHPSRRVSYLSIQDLARGYPLASRLQRQCHCPPVHLHLMHILLYSILLH